MNTGYAPYRFTNTTTFVMGNRKNAGKTTFMNWVLSSIRRLESPAFATIGVDGEQHDQIDGRAKPQVKCEPGDGVVSSYPMLQKSNALFRIEKAFPIKTPLGQLVAATTLRAGTLELVGPEHNDQLPLITGFLKHELGYSSLVIDGAASRLTPVGALSDSGFCYVLNIDRRNLKKALELMQLLAFGAALKTATAGEEVHSIEGALTAARLHTLPSGCKAIEVNNLTSLFLSYAQLQSLTSNTILRVRHPLELRAFVIILKDITEAEFEQLYRSKGINTPLIHNPYVHS
ncbi:MULTISPECIES: hypothetical protein [unclassified Carboxylicivirga]|uniref:hypothetical protein n=1 Tax=Carboxylicivirga TaxID=1628153 RepID=UPI003D334103